MSVALDHLRHITAETARFRALLAAVDPATPVPTCPGWDADDLLWHLTEVQSFWGRVVEQRCTDPETLRGPEVLRPDDRAALLALSRRSTDALARTLRRTPPTTPVWTWADDQSAGFVLRRQAHEALVHRVDAECTAGDRTPLDPALAADGVDEALRVMFGGAPEGAELEVDAVATVRLHSTDTDDRWLVTLARYTGAVQEGVPGSGPTLFIAPEDHGLPTAATVAAAAGDLDCWLWGRPPLGDVELAGDVPVLAGLREVVESGIS
ncbi:TIGR03083 family protein [Friedmanniella luteola]|uniref:TIGR03083 family protein n=1 Tax=Friedmanniella luteola TaxID=546871 RepID=A0A1H1P5A6_9ACTN|nr:maleylpyruvate isomerase family mycothiol-dependent enzyme [Friedmanniella luteola]SDS06175.1 TIGR03083 family protein [Friedmanniella luteola]